MEVTRCVSSHLMTGLLVWRNPQGSEENWRRRPLGIENGWKHAEKVISTELGLYLLTITSAVETVAYSALALVSLVLYPITDRPCKFFAKLLQSSSFTIIWGLADALLYNLTFINVITDESLARQSAEEFNLNPIVMFRLDDRLYVNHRYSEHRQANVDGELPRPTAEEPAPQELIDQGANLIQQYVLENASAETVELFRGLDPSIYMFVLTKAVYIYTVGAKKNDEIPNFFKPATKELILGLRKEDLNAATKKELQRLITDPAQFGTTLQEESAQSIFNKLRNTASGELQNSLFVFKCCRKAVEQLPA